MKQNYKTWEFKTVLKNNKGGSGVFNGSVPAGPYMISFVYACSIYYLLVSINSCIEHKHIPKMHNRTRTINIEEYT